MLGQFGNDQQLVKKIKLTDNLDHKSRLEMTIYLQILLHSFPQLSIYLSKVTRRFINVGLCTIFARYQILIRTEQYKIKISPRHLSIVYEVIPFHICNRCRLLRTDICLTKDGNKNIICTSTLASNQNVFSKNIQ